MQRGSTHTQCDWFVAVHCGAGYHHSKFHYELKQAMDSALRAAGQILSPTSAAAAYATSVPCCVDAVASAISILEDCPLSNAGLGSNLNIAGEVECDASLMHGGQQQSHEQYMYRHTSVGACKGVRNPILLAKHLMERSGNGTMSLGRIRPSMLAGIGCWKYLYATRSQHSLVIADTEASAGTMLVTQKCKKRYENHMERLRASQQTESDAAAPTGCIGQLLGIGVPNSKNDSLDSSLFDTVGAICLDSFGNLAAGVSSGGISLKMEGRIGEAALAGIGCYADNALGIACSLTGVGEDIMQNMTATRFSQELAAERTIEQAMMQTLGSDFCSYVGPHSQRNVGMIALQRSQSDDDEKQFDNTLEFSWGYTTRSMGLGYLSTGMGGNCVSFIAQDGTRNDDDPHRLNVGAVRIRPYGLGGNG